VLGGGPPWYLQEQTGRLGGESYSPEGSICLDFETTSADHGDSRTESNRIVAACVSVEGSPAYSVGLAKLRDELAKARILVAHNAKFELGWLMRHGLPWEHLLVWDTMSAERVRYGNLKVPVNLDATCKR